MTVVLSDRDLGRLRRLLADAAGLTFDDSRRESLAYGLSERLRSTGIADVSAYLDLVSDPRSPERQSLLDEVTIQETHFLRNPPQMQALRSQVLPELISAAQAGGRRLRIWSAGCSTGEEAYTLALLLRELLPSTKGWDVRVLATDLSEGALAAARTRTYGERAVQLVSPAQLRRFFRRTPAGRYVVREEVAELVSFSRHNLVLDVPPAGGLDLVLCRNVTIYFSRETTRALVSRIHASLRDGGYLLVGHAETLWQVNEDFRLVAMGEGDSSAYVYQRAGAAPPVRPAVTARGSARPIRGNAVSGLGGAAASPRLQALVPRQGVPGARVPPPDPGVAIRAALAGGQYEEAARQARTAAAAEPFRAQLHYLLGRVLMDLGQDDEALPALRRATYLDPSAGLAHFLLAGVLARSGDLPAAAREYRAAAATLGSDPAEADAAELGGRSIRELAALCSQLEAALLGQAASRGRSAFRAGPR